MVFSSCPSRFDTVEDFGGLFEECVMEKKQLFRLCHSCNTLNESEEEILRCSKCGKGFLPINYFEKIRARAKMSGQEGENLATFSFSPINGLIVFW